MHERCFGPQRTWEIAFNEEEWRAEHLKCTCIREFEGKVTYGVSNVVKISLLLLLFLFNSM